MHFTSIQLIDFKGITTTVSLDKATVLAGMNGSGKTTVLEGMYMALTRMLPGYRASQMDTATMLSLAGPSGKWTVLLKDSESGEVRVEFMGVQTRVRANFGDNSTSSQNNDHEQAIAERYGDFLVTLDLSSLLSMTPDNLRDFILDLCARGGGDSPWTVEQVIEDLTAKAPDIENEPDITEIPEDCDEPLDLLELLDTRIAESLTECRRGIIDANRTRKAEVPELPSPVALQDAEKTVADLDAKLAEAQEARGRIDGHQERRESIAADIETRKQSLQEAAEDIETLLADLKAAVALKGVLDTNEAALKADIAQLEANEPAALKSEAVKEPTQVSDKEHRDALLALHLCHIQVTSIDERLTKYKEGKCPECGQKASDTVDHLTQEKIKAQKKFETADAKVTKLAKQFKTAAAKVKKAQDTIEAQKEAVQATQKAHHTWRKGLDAKDHALELLQEKQKTNDGNGLRIEASLEKINTKTIALKEDVKRFQKTLADIPNPVDELTTIDTEITDIKEILTVSRKDAESLRAEDRKAREALGARDTAEVEHNRLQDWQTTVKAAERALMGIRREVVSSYVDPVVSRVTNVIGDYLGTFEARFDPRFQLGFSRETGAWVQLHRLSDGEFAMLSLALAYALCDLQNPPTKILMMDNIHGIDPNNMEPFMQTVSNMAGTALDQILLAGMGLRSRFSVPGTDIEIVDMDEATKVTKTATVAV